MKILITGGDGFISRNIKEKLNNKYCIFTPDSYDLDVLDFLKVERFIKDHHINIIIHTAFRADKEILKNTLTMFASIVRNIDYVDKIIYFGSGAEYDKSRNLIKVKETSLGSFIPQDNYGLAKYICCQIAKNEKKILTLRLFGLYGKYEDYRCKFISNAIVKNILCMPIKIKQNVIFDYLFIDDLVKVVDYFLTHKHQYNCYNITPNQPISLSAIAKIINSIANKKSKISIINKGMNFQYTGDNSRLKKAIPHLSFTSYKKGIKQLYNYYAAKIDKIDKKSIIEDQYYIKSRIHQ